MGPKHCHTYPFHVVRPKTAVVSNAGVREWSCSFTETKSGGQAANGAKFICNAYNADHRV